jgi:DNA-directed RNA polymerase specialized sigma24 family protein
MGVSAREFREPGPAHEKEFEAIYRRKFPLALRFARRYLDDEAAEDAVQAVFMEYWEGYTRRPALAFGADARPFLPQSATGCIRYLARRRPLDGSCATCAPP